MTNHRLGRIVEHDPRSRQYKFDTSEIEVRSVKHRRVIPVLDQGDLGSCVGNAVVGALGTDPFYATVADIILDQAVAVDIYSDATKLDEFPGAYPPIDTGTSGLAGAKAAKNLGFISGYTHTFSFIDALKALTTTPVITGINWYESFDFPRPGGMVDLDGNVLGGHEVVLDEISAELGLIGATNSWGSSWGNRGRFYIKFEDYERLLDEQGDVTVFTPLTEPAPIPVPNPDAEFAVVLHKWLNKHPWFYKNVQTAAKTWLAAKSL